MTTTIVELVVNPGNSGVVCSLFADRLRSGTMHPTVAEAYTGICCDERRIVVLIVSWHSIEAAKDFELEVWPELAVALRPFLDADPRVRTFAARAVFSHGKPGVVDRVVPAERDIQVA